MKIKKEVTVAGIIGLLIGAVVVGGVLRAKSALQKIESSLNSTLKGESFKADTNSDPTSLFLTLETADNQITASNKITIAGRTLPKDMVAGIVINGENGDSIIVPDELGSFSQDISLVKGANTIHVTVYQDDGTKVDSTITVVYTTSEIWLLPHFLL